MIMGMSLNVHNDVPQNDTTCTIVFSQDEIDSADAEIQSLLQKKAITHCNPTEQGQFVNNVFLTPKKDGGWLLNDPEPKKFQLIHGQTQVQDGNSQLNLGVGIQILLYDIH